MAKKTDYKYRITHKRQDTWRDDGRTWGYWHVKVEIRGVGDIGYHALMDDIRVDLEPFFGDVTYRPIKEVNRGLRAMDSLSDEDISALPLCFQATYAYDTDSRLWTADLCCLKEVAGQIGIKL